MANVVQPIGVAGFIEEHNRGLEKNRDISKWFLEEKLTIDFGDYVGRPSAKITLQKEYLTRFLENGWTIDHVEQTVESGTWETSSDTLTTNDSGTSTSSSKKSAGTSKTSEDNSTESERKQTDEKNSTSSSSSDGTQTDNYSRTNNSSSNSSSNRDVIENIGAYNSSSSVNYDHTSSQTAQSTDQYTSSTSGERNNSTNTTESSNSSTESKEDYTDTKTSGSSSNSISNDVDTLNDKQTSKDVGTKDTETNDVEDATSTGVSSGTETSSTKASGAAFWATVQRITLKRRRMQPELVLQDMIDSYVTERNEGVTNEDARYNELVTLYGIMLNRNETEGNAIVNSALDVTGLFNSLRESVQNTWSAAHNAAVDLKIVASDGAVVEIRYEYEALIAKTRSQMIGQGTYNGTVWPMVEAGIRRQMDAAIVEAKAKGLASASSAITNVLEAKGDVMAQLVNAKNAIASAIDNRKITVIELRNTVMQAMLNFMGSREDAYPQIQEISQLASQIGFTVGAAGNVL